MFWPSQAASVAVSARKTHRSKMLPLLSSAIQVIGSTDQRAGKTNRIGIYSAPPPDPCTTPPCAPIARRRGAGSSRSPCPRLPAGCATACLRAGTGAGWPGAGPRGGSQLDHCRDQAQNPGVRSRLHLCKPQEWASTQPGGGQGNSTQGSCGNCVSGWRCASALVGWHEYFPTLPLGIARVTTDHNAFWRRGMNTREASRCNLGWCS